MMKLLGNFNNLAYSSGLMFVWLGHFYNCF